MIKKALTPQVGTDAVDDEELELAAVTTEMLPSKKLSHMNSLILILDRRDRIDVGVPFAVSPGCDDRSTSGREKSPPHKGMNVRKGKDNGP